MHSQNELGNAWKMGIIFVQGKDQLSVPPSGTKQEKRS